MGVTHEETNISRFSFTHASPSIRGTSFGASNSPTLIVVPTQPVHFNVFLELATLYAPCNNKLKIHLRTFLDKQVCTILVSFRFFVFCFFLFFELTAHLNRQSISMRVCHGLGSVHKGRLCLKIPHPAKSVLPPLFTIVFCNGYIV